MKLTFATLAVLGLALVPAVAHAETSAGDIGWALSRFRPAPLATDGLHAERPRGLGHLALGATATYDWGHRPLVVTRAEDGIGVARRDVVTGQSFVTPAIAFGLFDRLTLYAALPIAVYQNGAGYGSVPNRRRTVLGDARFGARATLLGVEPDARVVVGVAAEGFVRTGSRASWTGDGAMRARVAVLFEFLPTARTYVIANLGVMARPERRALDMRSGPEAALVLGFGVMVRDLRLGVELASSTGLGRDTFARVQTTPFEALAVASFHRGPLHLAIGAGPGFTQAAGSPELRAVLRLGYAFERETRPPPAPVAPKRTGPDLDGDGIDDSLDACPSVKGPESSDPRAHGCPDKDGDGVSDGEDACVAVAGPRSDDPKTTGCPKVTPADRDKDGIFDKDDACPDVPGDYSDDAKRNGCPGAAEPPQELEEPDLPAPTKPKK